MAARYLYSWRTSPSTVLKKNKEAAKRPLQRQLNRIEEWANKWNFKFSVDNCATLTFTKKRSKDPLTFKLNGSHISEVTQ